MFLFKSLNVTVLDPSNLWRWGNLVVDIEPALIITSALQTLYILDALVFESQLVTTFELQAEGLGYMRVLQYSLYPFFATSTTKYLYEHGQGREINLWILAAILLVYISGYILYRGSNSQKNAFRLNPYGPTVNRKYFYFYPIFYIRFTIIKLPIIKDRKTINFVFVIF